MPSSSHPKSWRSVVKFINSMSGACQSVPGIISSSKTLGVPSGVISHMTSANDHEPMPSSWGTEPKPPLPMATASGAFGAVSP